MVAVVVVVNVVFAVAIVVDGIVGIIVLIVVVVVVVVFLVVVEWNSLFRSNPNARDSQSARQSRGTICSRAAADWCFSAFPCSELKLLKLR